MVGIVTIVGTDFCVVVGGIIVVLSVIGTTVIGGKGGRVGNGGKVERTNGGYNVEEINGGGGDGFHGNPRSGLLFGRLHNLALYCISSNIITPDS